MCRKCALPVDVFFTLFLAKIFALLVLMGLQRTVIRNRSTLLLQLQSPFCHRRIQLLVEFARLHSLNDRLNDLVQFVQSANLDRALAVCSSPRWYRGITALQMWQGPHRHG